MTVSTKSQATQARVLVGMQRRVQAGTGGPASASYLASLFRSAEAPLSSHAVAAALKLLEDKGLVERQSWPSVSGMQHRWFLTKAGLDAEVK